MDGIHKVIYDSPPPAVGEEISFGYNGGSLFSNATRINNYSVKKNKKKYYYYFYYY